MKKGKKRFRMKLSKFRNNLVLSQAGSMMSNWTKICPLSTRVRPIPNTWAPEIQHLEMEASVIQLLDMAKTNFM